MPLIPEDVARELPALLEELRTRWRDLECRGSGPEPSPRGVARRNLDIATRLVLADLEHCISSPGERGQQISARRWESLLQDLRGLKRRLDAQP